MLLFNDWEHAFTAVAEIANYHCIFWCHGVELWGCGGVVGSNTDIHFARFEFRFTILSLTLECNVVFVVQNRLQNVPDPPPHLPAICGRSWCVSQKVDVASQKRRGPLFPQTRNRFNTSITVVHFSTSLYLPLVKGDYLVMEEGHCKLHVAWKVRLFCNFFVLCKGLLWAWWACARGCSGHPALLGHQSLTAVKNKCII